MSLRDMLEKIVNSTEGAMSAMIMGYDGIAVDEVTAIDATSDIDMQLLSVEYATVLKAIKSSIEVVKAGEMEEVSISSSKARAVIRAVNDDFFLIAILLKEGNFGKARYMLKMAAPEMSRSLS